MNQAEEILYDIEILLMKKFKLNKDEVKSMISSNPDFFVRVTIQYLISTTVSPLIAESFTNAILSNITEKSADSLNSDDKE